MRWEEIRKHFRDEWLLLEGLKMRREDDKIIHEDLAVIDVFPDSSSALKEYKRLHREAPLREYLVYHTSNETVEETERVWVGIRRAAP